MEHIDHTGGRRCICTLDLAGWTQPWRSSLAPCGHMKTIEKEPCPRLAVGRRPMRRSHVPGSPSDFGSAEGRRRRHGRCKVSARVHRAATLRRTPAPQPKVEPAAPPRRGYTVHTDHWDAWAIVVAARRARRRTALMVPGRPGRERRARNPEEARTPTIEFSLGREESAGIGLGPA